MVCALHLFLDVPSARFDPALAFWAAATGWTPSSRRGESGQFLTLEPPAGPAWVKLQAVEGPGGVHLDLDHRDRDEGVERALELGATRAWRYHDVEVMRSPGGFVFCLTLGGPAPSLMRDRDPILDQVCLDIPASRWETETSFWRDLTGRELTGAATSEFARLVAGGEPRILLQRLDESEGVVRAHPDFATSRRAAATEEQVTLGAEVVAVEDWWTVLRAPGGQVYCLTDRDPATGDVRRPVTD